MSENKQIALMSLFIGSCIFAAWVVLRIPSALDELSHAHRFEVGDCIKSHFQKERWEDPNPLLRIVERGKSSYRTCFMPCNLEVSDERSHTLYFDETEYYEKTNCQK